MSFDAEGLETYAVEWKVSIPFVQGNVFRPKRCSHVWARNMSQSLSFRAMSFDKERAQQMLKNRVSIPFVQGNVFRRNNGRAY